MTYPRPTLAITNLYYIQNLLKRPTIIVILATLSLVILVIHQFYSSSTQVGFAYYRNGSTLEYGRSPREAEPELEKNRFVYDLQLKAEFRKSPSDASDLLQRIEDLKKIKTSIRNELKSIEHEKAKLLKDMASLVAKNEKLVAQISRSKMQLKQLELDITETRKRKIEQSCDVNRVSPVIFNPMKSSDIEEFLKPSRKTIEHHPERLAHVKQKDAMTTVYINQFDLSLCPLTKEFKFYLVEPTLNEQVTVVTDDPRLKIDPVLTRNLLSAHRQYTRNLSEACMVISLLDLNNDTPLNSSNNNLVINLIDRNFPAKELKERAKDADSTVFASSSFEGTLFRATFDIVLPGIWQPPANYESIVSSIPPQSPLERKYLASYFGSSEATKRASISPEDFAPNRELDPLEKILQVVHRNSIDDLFLFVYNCGMETNLQCYEEKEKMIELSTFLIILCKSDIIDDDTNNQLYLALSRGAIPVIVGKERVRLPFDEVIDWRRAAILIPTSRLPELHFILRSYNPADLYQLKYHGRRIFENYLATSKQILDTLISLMSIERFNHPPPPVPDIKTISYYPSSDLNLDVNCTSTACNELKADSLNSLISSEIYGPREKPFASPSFRRNFSLSLNMGYDLWNNPMYSPLQLFPSYPIDPVTPSEHKFLSSDLGYRPIGDGLGGSGLEFSRSLGGDRITEQFTIVLLTYERKSILMKTIERMKGLAYLNKILVVWNGLNHKPSKDIIWPDVGVPIEVVKVNRNSLNNRFLPYDSIETDAVLSLDDDSPLRPDEIVFAFRVWRQSRDQIVGFPGRFHAWDINQNSWMYNSNHSCELSMVLTGGAFFHKYYSYLYTYTMPEAIRSIVDKFMNCEDIAMNFLVAHLTRKPPIKVTSRWTFHCPSCASSLSEDDSHFRERHECLNTFASIYGYMPLLNTQHRSDSVLFKTRLPHDKQKCFKFV